MAIADVAAVRRLSQLLVRETLRERYADKATFEELTGEDLPDGAEIAWRVVANHALIGPTNGLEFRAVIDQMADRIREQCAVDVELDYAQTYVMSTRQAARVERVEDGRAAATDPHEVNLLLTEAA